MLLRLKRDEEARNTLRGIDLDEIKNNSTALIRVAMLRQKLDMGGDLPFLYRARQVDFNSADVHHAYVQLFMSHTRRERGDLDVNGVAVDSAVHLVDAQGAKHTYVIVEQEEYDLQRGEIPSSDERAVRLMGRHVGNRVRFNEGRADEVEYEIADIQSKYVYAFQQTINRHTEWFGGSEEMIAGRREFLGKIKSFVEQHTIVLPAVKALDVPGSQLEEYYEVLGESASASLFVASEMKLPLFLDDMVLNQIATDQRWQVQGVTTQLVLLRMKSRGLISLAEYYAALKKLILGNYAYILIDSHALWWMCRNEDMKATTGMQRILQRTLGPECVPAAALRVGAEFIYRVWLEVGDKQEKLQLIDYVLDTLKSGKEAAQVKEPLKEMLTAIFRFLPAALPQVFERIDTHNSTQRNDDENGEKEMVADGIGKGTSAG